MTTITIISIAAIAIVIASVVITIVKGLVNLINKLSLAFVKAPGKGMKKFISFVRIASSNRLKSKHRKLVMKEDENARWNAAKHNPNYKTDKIERLEAKLIIKNKKR